MTTTIPVKMTIAVVSPDDNLSCRPIPMLTWAFMGLRLQARRDCLRSSQGALRAAAARAPLAPLRRPLALDTREGQRCRGTRATNGPGETRQELRTGASRCLDTPPRQSAPQTALRAPRIPARTPSPQVLAEAWNDSGVGALPGSHARPLALHDRLRSPPRPGGCPPGRGGPRGSPHAVARLRGFTGAERGDRPGRAGRQRRAPGGAHPVELTVVEDLVDDVGRQLVEGKCSQRSGEHAAAPGGPGGGGAPLGGLRAARSASMFALVRRGARSSTRRAATAAHTCSPLRASARAGGSSRTDRGAHGRTTPGPDHAQDPRPAPTARAGPEDAAGAHLRTPAQQAGPHASAASTCCRTACRETPSTRPRSA